MSEEINPIIEIKGCEYPPEVILNRECGPMLSVAYRRIADGLIFVARCDPGSAEGVEMELRYLAEYVRRTPLGGPCIAKGEGELGMHATSKGPVSGIITLIDMERRTYQVTVELPFDACKENEERKRFDAAGANAGWDANGAPC